MEITKTSLTLALPMWEINALLKIALIKRVGLEYICRQVIVGEFSKTSFSSVWEQVTGLWSLLLHYLRLKLHRSRSKYYNVNIQLTPLERRILKTQEGYFGMTHQELCRWYLLSVIRDFFPHDVPDKFQIEDKNSFSLQLALYIVGLGAKYQADEILISREFNQLHLTFMTYRSEGRKIVYSGVEHYIFLPVTKRILFRRYQDMCRSSSQDSTSFTVKAASIEENPRFLVKVQQVDEKEINDILLSLKPMNSKN